MLPSARRVPTRVTPVLVGLRGSRDVKPKVRVGPITRPVLDERNANNGTKRRHELLVESLEKYGAGRSVVVDRHDLEGRTWAEPIAKKPQSGIYVRC